MANGKIQELLLGATKVAYKSKYQYCNRVIRSLLNLKEDKATLVDKEIEILCVMCKMCLEGNCGDINKGRPVLKEMEALGLELVSVDTLRNYRYTIRKKGWLEKDQLSLRLRKAVADGAFCTAIFLDRR